MGEVLMMPACRAVVYSPVARWDETESAGANADEARDKAIKRAVDMRMGALCRDKSDADIWQDMIADGWRLQAWRFGVMPDD